ncbi:flavin reductase family protein [Thermovirga sp.]|uniref:flavin reductase family protein n=1 Tax=Thermovirga sp. TaxID=2699834 RepID=UPI0025F38F1A|nr:flavin reductase family protein [Thermovirga sp.]MBO8153721.1 flavin reductase [Thermovirga sp.]
MPEKEIDTRALFGISYGLYVLSSRLEDKLNGQIASVVVQVTSDPIVLACCLHKDNFTTKCIRESRMFSISILEEETPMTFIGNFGFKSGRDIDKFSSCKCELTERGVPYTPDYSLAVIEAEVISEVDVFTHVLFFGKVVHAKVLKDGTPMTYSYYHEVKKGKSPKHAPTFGIDAGKIH